MIAARLNRRYRDSIAAEDVVQSAMGSFFRAARLVDKASIKLESTASAWNILATFARRKLARALERESASKRGAGRTRVSLDSQDVDLGRMPSELEADELFDQVLAVLGPEHAQLLRLLLANATQREIAEQLGIDERTVRRRLATIRESVRDKVGPSHVPTLPEEELLGTGIHLPNISYRQFVLGKLIGRGALGKVYRARLQSDGQVVAVKFMHRYLWADSLSRASFLREIDHASKLDHPSILKYLGWGQSPHGGPYLVSEYIDGQPLTTAKRNDSNDALQMLIQVCEAIESSHQAGVVHGDLTPSNILVDQNRRIVLTDFGFSTLARQPREHAYVVDPLESMGGTLGFAAPEQISSAFGAVCEATDIYAIGGLAYYLLTGQSPHDGMSWLDTLADRDVSIEVREGTQAESKLAKVARVALKKAIHDRPKSVTQLRELLQRR